jgi:hypothetical protein
MHLGDLIYLKCCFGLFCTIFFVSAPCFCEDDLIVRAKDESSAYSLEAEFAWPEYRFEAKISVEASPDSEFLFSSNANMQILQTVNYRWERMWNVPLVVSDDRAVKSTTPGGEIYAGPFTGIENWERLHINGEVFDLRDDEDKVSPPDFARPVSQVQLILGTACVPPFDWPLHGTQTFDPISKEVNLYKHLFGEDHCASSRSKKANFWKHIG